MAIDYRIRYAFAITPNRQLAAWKGAMHLNPKYSHASLASLRQEFQDKEQSV